MNYKIEEDFIKKFVEKKYRNRCLFELSSPKKRGEAIRQLSSKFKHSLEITCGKSHNEIIKTLANFFSLSKKVYTISDMSCIDCSVRIFTEVFSEVMHGGGTYIILCDENTIFAKDEVFGTASKYIFHAK